MKVSKLVSRSLLLVNSFLLLRCLLPHFPERLVYFVVVLKGVTLLHRWDGKYHIICDTRNKQPSQERSSCNRNTRDTSHDKTDREVQPRIDNTLNVCNTPGKKSAFSRALRENYLSVRVALHIRWPPILDEKVEGTYVAPGSIRVPLRSLCRSRVLARRRSHFRHQPEATR